MNKLFDEVFSRVCRNEFVNIHTETSYMRGMLNMMSYLDNIDGEMWWKLNQAIEIIYNQKR